MNFWSSVRHVYGGSWAALWALPVVVSGLVALEALQHAVEWQAGMYSGPEGMARAAYDEARLTVGTAKELWLLAIQYPLIRFILTGSASRARRLDGPALRGFAIVFAYSVAMMLIVVWAPVIRPEAARAVGLVMLAAMPLGIALTPWMVGAPLGDVRANPVFALRRAWGSIWWGFGILVVTVLPTMAAHYALGFLAVGRPPQFAIPLLLLDALVVGYLGALTAAHAVPIAARMAASKSEALVLHDPS